MLAYYPSWRCSSIFPNLTQERFQLLNAFDTPKLTYDGARKRFACEDGGVALSLHAGPAAKVAMLRERFLLVQQRVQRNEMFTKPLTAAGGGARSYVELSSVDTLLGGGDGSRMLLGMLVEVEEGRFWLEDLNAHVPLDLNHAVRTKTTSTGPVHLSPL